MFLLLPTALPQRLRAAPVIVITTTLPISPPVAPVLTKELAEEEEEREKSAFWDFLFNPLTPLTNWAIPTRIR
jgi:hypothetical protein